MPRFLRSGNLPGSGTTLTFEQAGNFAASDAAVKHLTDRGFAVGTLQGNDPRGIFFDRKVSIGKWRTLLPLERDGLHGQITGDPRNGPVLVTVFETAPAEAHDALRSPVPTHDFVSRALDRSSDILIGSVAAVCIAGIAFVTFLPAWTAPTEAVVAKTFFRAGPVGLRAAAGERR